MRAPRSGPPRRQPPRGAAAAALVLLVVVAGAACAPTRPPPPPPAPDYTVVSKHERVEGRHLRFYLTQVVAGTEREIEVKRPCYRLATIGEVIPATTVTTDGVFTVEWKCRWRELLRAVPRSVPDRR